jgi:hypothetical protein
MKEEDSSEGNRIEGQVVHWEAPIWFRRRKGKMENQ